jgi:hypothetical protein
MPVAFQPSLAGKVKGCGMRPTPQRLTEIHVGSSPGQKNFPLKPPHLPADIVAVDFPHGDVDAFPPHAAAEAAFAAALAEA